MRIWASALVSFSSRSRSMIADPVVAQLEVILVAGGRPGDGALAQDRGRLGARQLPQSRQLLLELVALAPQKAASRRGLGDSGRRIAHQESQLARPGGVESGLAGELAEPLRQYGRPRSSVAGTIAAGRVECRLPSGDRRPIELRRAGVLHRLRLAAAPTAVPLSRAVRRARRPPAERAMGPPARANGGRRETVSCVAELDVRT